MNPKILCVFTDNEKGMFNEIRPLENKEYEEYKKSVNRVYYISNDLALYNNVLMNYNQYYDTLDSNLDAYSKNQRMNWFLIDEIVFNLNRCLLNFLMSIRVFLDHSEHNIKKNYGKDSERYKTFQRITSRCYDRYFSYRFLYKLRNYVQHCGMPVGNIKLYSGLDETELSVNHSLTLYFDRDDLLKKYDSWGSVLEDEISDFPKILKLIPILKL